MTQTYSNQETTNDTAARYLYLQKFREKKRLEREELMRSLPGRRLRDNPDYEAIMDAIAEEKELYPYGHE